MWVAIMVAATTQLDPAAGGSLPGFDAAQWQPPARVAAAQPAGPYEYHRVYSSDDAVAWAVLDLKMLQQVDPAAIPFCRWIWIPPQGDVTWIEANSLVVNSACNQSSLIVLPEVVSGGWLLRWDLRKLAPKPDDQHVGRTLWREQRLDRRIRRVRVLGVIRRQPLRRAIRNRQHRAGMPVR
jgi:hypothetical protein